MSNLTFVTNTELTAHLGCLRSNLLGGCALEKSKALTTGEIAKVCGVNFRTVIRWIEKGYIKAYKLPGRGDNRVKVEDFVSFLEANDMPVPEAYLTNSESKRAAKPASKPETAKQRILIIEDDDNMAKSIARGLSRAGYEVDRAATGVEAGIKLATFKPELVTLDLNMPGMSGLEVLAVMKAKSEYAGIKVLLVSAAGKADLILATDSGADAVLEKPFKNEDLLKSVAGLCAGK